MLAALIAAALKARHAQAPAADAPLPIVEPPAPKAKRKRDG